MAVLYITEDDVRSVMDMEKSLLITHKVFAGRPRDLEDVKSILLRNPDIDLQYIRKWLREFDESSHNETFLENFEKIFKDINHL